jgi:hypothetical protein
MPKPTIGHRLRPRFCDIALADPAISVTRAFAQKHPKPTLTAAGHGSLAALTLTAMGWLPKVLPAIR